MDIKKIRPSPWHIIAALGAIFLIESAIVSKWNVPKLPYSELKTAIAAGNDLGQQSPHVLDAVLFSRHELGIGEDGDLRQ